MSGKVRIVEMALRDGLQNEKIVLPTAIRAELAQRIVQAGCKDLEIGAFVSPKWVPQMAGTVDVIKEYRQLAGKKFSDVKLSALVPNDIGMQSALENKLDEVAIFTACSEGFAKNNINCSVDESFERFIPVMQMAKKNKIKVRGYLSTVFGCPFDGIVEEKKVIQLVHRLLELGVYEVSLGDTIGIANVGQVESLLKKLLKQVPAKKLAMHFHDTRGQALANILASYRMGIRSFDASLAGLGGCPYAPGASGNVATEDVVFMFEGLGVNTGLNFKELVKIHGWLSKAMNKPLPSKAGSVHSLHPSKFDGPVRGKNTNK